MEMEQGRTEENGRETYQNKMKLEFINRSENEAFARIAVAAFISQADPTMEELTEVKTAVSEGVSNSVIHAYESGTEGTISVECIITEDRKVILMITDFGVGIENIAQAREPLFTSRPEEERSGMGFTVMESFMDQLEITSVPGEGTRLVLVKKLDKAYEL